MNRQTLSLLASILFLLLVCFPAPLLAKSFGAPLGQKQATPISAILENPDAYVGKTVQVRGLVVEVCAARGCWMHIAGDKPFEKLRFKVNDGDMVFPMTARGKMATVEGVLQKFVLTREEVIARRKHHAEETGQPFDPASVTTGETVYQLRGLGAVVDGL
jgi:hypothetical protein